MSTNVFNTNPPATTMGQFVALNLAPGFQEISKIGYNPAVTGATTVDIWNTGGSYVPLIAEQGLEVVSASANDTAAGTGARTMRIGYLTSTFVSKTTDVIMNGVTAVPTTALDIMYINSFRVLTAGSGGVAAGAITLRVLSAGATQSQIAIGQTRGRKMWYTVPKGKILILEAFTYGVGGADNGNGKDFIKYTLRANYDENAGAMTTVEYPLWEASSVTGGNQVELSTPIAYPAGVTVRMVATGSSATSNAVAQVTWRGILADA